jgi:hypothetical protein
MDDELKADFAKAKSAILDRMILAGWLSKTASTTGHAVCQPTPKGHAIISAVRDFIFLDDKPLSPLEFSAFRDIMRTLNPLE